MYEMPIVSVLIRPALRRLSVTVGTLEARRTVPNIGGFRNNGIYWDSREPTSCEIHRAYAILGSHFRITAKQQVIKKHTQEYHPPPGIQLC
jgi:hypothetical protein